MIGWIVGGIVGFIGIFGLYVSSRAHDNIFYVGGFLVFLAAVIYLSRAVKQAFDRWEAAYHVRHSSQH